MRTSGKPQWTKQDYEMVAGVLRQNQEIDDQAKLDLAWYFVVVFGNDNPQFRVLQFLSASGIPITAEEATAQFRERTAAAKIYSILRRPEVRVRSHRRRE